MLPPRVRSRLRKTVGAVAVLLGVVVCAYLLRRPLFERRIADAIAAALSESLGGTWTVDAVEGGWISDVRVSGVRALTPPREGPVRNLSIARADVTCSPFGLLSGVSSIRTVTVTGLDLDLDLVRPRKQATSGEGAPLLANLPKEIPQIDIDGALVLRTSDGDLKCDRIAVHGTTEALAIDGAGLATRDVGTDGPWAALGRQWSARFTRPSATRLELVGADELAGVAFRALTVELAGEGGAHATGDASVGGGVVKFAFGPASTHVEAQEVDLARVPVWIVGVAGLTPSITPSAGRADVTVDQVGDGPTRVQLSARECQLPDLPTITCEASLVVVAGDVQLQSVDGMFGGLHVVAQGVSLYGGAPWIVRNAESMRVSTDDLLSTLRAFGVADADLARLASEGRVAVAATLGCDNPKRLNVSELTIAAKGVQIQAKGEIALPERRADWRNSALALRADVVIDADTAISRRWFGLDLEGRLTADVVVSGAAAAPTYTFVATADALRIETREASDVQVKGSYGDGTLEVTTATASAFTGKVTARGTLVPRTGELRGAALTFEVPQIERLLTSEVKAPPPITGPFALVLEGSRKGESSAPTDEATWRRGLTASADVTSNGWALSGVPVGKLSAHIESDGVRATLTSVAVDWPGAEVTGGGEVQLESGVVSGLTIRARIADLGKCLAPLTSTQDQDAGTSTQITGRGEVTISASEFTLGAKNGNQPTTASFRAELALEAVQLDSLAIGTLTATASLRGDAAEFSVAAEGSTFRGATRGGVVRGEQDGDGARVSLAEASVQAFGFSARLTEPASFNVKDGGLTKFHATIEGRRESQGGGDAASSGPILVSGSYDGGLDVELAADTLDGAFISDGFAGTGRVRATVRGAPARPDIAVTAQFDELRTGDIVASVTLSAVQDALGARVETLSVRATVVDVAPDRSAVRGKAPAVAPLPVVRLDAKGGLPFVIGSASDSRSVAVPFTGRIASDDLGAWLTRFGVTGFVIPHAELDFGWEKAALTAELVTAGVRWTIPGLGQIVTDGTFAVRARMDAETTRIELDSRFQSGGTLKANVTCAAAVAWNDLPGTADRMRSAPLSGEVAVAIADLAVPSDADLDGLTADGRVEGRVTIGGTLTSPTLNGRLDAAGVTLRPDASGRTFDQGTLALQFSGRDVTIERLAGRFGYGPVTAHGTVALGGGEGTTLDLVIEGQNVLLAQSDTVRLRADLDLKVTGPLAASSVSGDVSVRDALLALELSTASSGNGGGDSAGAGLRLFALPAGPLGNATLDVHVTAKNTLRVVSDRVRGVASADLQIRGTGALPEPEGRIEFPGMRVLLPFSRFVVDSGTLDFARASPFSPRVYATARFRSRDYDVTARASGEITALQIDVTTVPALPRDEALLLVVSGASPRDFADGGFDGVALSRAQSLIGSELLAQFVRPGDPEERSFFDRLSLDISRNRDASGRNGIEAAYEVDEDLLVRIEQDQYLNYNFGFVARVRFR